MYLKEISATGFKSFADKLKITLDNKFNIILISKFLEYRDSILKLDKYLN